MQQNGMDSQVIDRSVLQRWSHFTVKDWQKQFDLLRVGVTGSLDKSFNYDITMGEQPQIKIEYLQYGKFIDMGVGKGVNVADVRGNAGMRSVLGKGVKGRGAKARLFAQAGITRVPKKWFGRKYRFNFYRLMEIMQQLYLNKGPEIIKNDIENNGKE